VDVDRVLDLPRQLQRAAIVINGCQMIASMQVYISDICQLDQIILHRSSFASVGFSWLRKTLKGGIPGIYP